MRSQNRLATHFSRWAVAIAALCLLPAPAWAGGGPENLFLVINENSDVSKTIANHYIRMRKIPACNVMYLDWKGGLNNTTGKAFREQILSPILKEIEARQIVPQIDYIVYSADFPWRVDFRKDFEGQELPKQFRPKASLTGATYLWAYTMQNNPALVMPTTNWYVPKSPRNNGSQCIDCGDVKTQGFRSRQGWLEGGGKTEEKAKGQRYFLSAMLGVTVARGNSEAEILNYLGRAAAADATQPTGTFYYMKNTDVRSKARHGCYSGVGTLLMAEGAEVVIRDGDVPEQATSALGIMAGTSKFSLDANQVNIAPGAICEHLTSYGAEYSARWQTKISSWLRAGAAGSSGTVFEPFAIQAKFPLPTLHLHYRRGASLAEAYYQSVMGPYQLLVVGDPLCQPWAKPPKVTLPTLTAGSTVRGVVELKAEVEPQPGTEVGGCELYVDGRQVARYPPTFTPPLNTAKLAPGEHEIRIVATTADPLEFQGHTVVPFSVASAGVSPGAGEKQETPGQPTPEQPSPEQPSPEQPSPEQQAPVVRLEVSPQPVVAAGEKIAVRVQGPANAAGIEILQNLRRVGFVQGNAGTVEIDSKVLGRGPVALVAAVAPAPPKVEGKAGAEAEDADSPQSGATPRWQRPRSAPVWLLVR